MTQQLKTLCPEPDLSVGESLLLRVFLLHAYVCVLTHTYMQCNHFFYYKCWEIIRQLTYRSEGIRVLS